MWINMVKSANVLIIFDALFKISEGTHNMWWTMPQIKISAKAGGDQEQSEYRDNT